MGISKCALVVVLFASTSLASSSFNPKTQPAELERRQSWTAFNNLSPHRFRVNHNNLINPFFKSHVPANLADGRARFIDNDKGLIIKVSDYSDYYGGGLPIPPGDGLSVFASGPPSLREARRDQEDFRLEDLDDFDDGRSKNNKEEEDDIFKDVSDDPFLSVIVSAAADNPELLDPESSPNVADEDRDSKEENEQEFQGPAKRRVARSAVLAPAKKILKRKSQLKPQVRDSYHVPIYTEAPGNGPSLQKFGFEDAIGPPQQNYPARNGLHHAQGPQDDQTDESDTYAVDGEGESAEGESDGASGTYFNHQQQAQDDTYSNAQVNIGHGPEPADDDEDESDGDRPQYADEEGGQSYLQQQQPHNPKFFKNDHDDDRQFDFPRKRHFYKRAQPYHFQYYVKDDFTHNDFGQQERSDGNAVHGSYRVKLPDGRTQIVSYIADRKTGYQANVKYEGTAHHPPPSYYNKNAEYQAGDLGNLKIKF